MRFERSEHDETIKQNKQTTFVNSKTSVACAIEHKL
jgi:hypothetical protein